MFTTEDKASIERKGITMQQVDEQIEKFRRGFPFLPIVKAAEKGDGIISMSAEQFDEAVGHYEKVKDSKEIIKFVPASGAATRMFQDLFKFVNEGIRSESVDTLLEHIEEFPFYPELKEHLHPGDSDVNTVNAILKTGLGYGYLPKGLVTFHRYGQECRKAAEEHLVEGARYAESRGKVRLHFTVSPEHMEAFRTLFAEKVPSYEERFGVKYDITFSVQQPSTDTIAVTMENIPFRTDDGNLLFRPAGHGALIKNLGAMDADLIFIKNIDNVTTDARKDDTIRYKKALAGLLLKVQSQSFEMLRRVRSGECGTEEAARFISGNLMVKLPDDCSRELLVSILDRPIRVCGMVRNEGEAGGGPFWAENSDGTVSLQIAESNQIAPERKDIMKTATHFNPVDLVCGIRKADGTKYNLEEFVDPQTAFISKKSFAGRDLKAMELPGLWNGAMSKWNTLFVEVPITIFSPVKTVNDLLRPQHR